MSESNSGLNKNQLQNAYQRPVANIYDLYLTGSIGDAKDYQDWNQMMRAASENDVVYIHINSNGGEIFTAIQMMRAIEFWGLILAIRSTLWSSCHSRGHVV